LAGRPGAAVCSLIVGSSATPSGVLRVHSTNAAPKRMVRGVGVGHAHSANHVLGCVDVDGVRQVFRRRGASGLAWSSMIPRCPPHACDIVRVSRPSCLPARPACRCGLLRRHDGESAGRPCVSDGVDLAAIGDCDAGTGGALRCGPLSRHTPKHPPAGRASLAGSARAVRDELYAERLRRKAQATALQPVKRSGPTNLRLSFEAEAGMDRHGVGALT
jgi:hypothetical protein